MASLKSTGSPTSRVRPAHFTIYDEEELQSNAPGVTTTLSDSSTSADHKSGTLDVLSSSRLGNSPVKRDHDSTEIDKCEQPICKNVTEDQSQVSMSLQPKLSTMSIRSNEENVQPQDGSASDTSLLTPASASKSNTVQSTEDPKHPSTSGSGAIEVARLQRELNKAQDQLARQAQQLDSTRALVTSSMPSSEISQNPLNSGINRQAWANNDDARSDFAEFNSHPNDWGAHPRSGFHYIQPDPWGFPSNRGYGQRGGAGLAPTVSSQEPQNRNYSLPLSPIGSNLGRGLQQASPYHSNRGLGFSAYGSRGNGFAMYNAPMQTNFNGMPSGSAMQPQGYQPQPIGTPLSPAASSFNPGQGSQQANPWNSGPTTSSDQTYVPPVEPLNYRRLLDRSVSCNWKYIVDKIVCNYDQQASIFLQQKLKVGTVEQKFEIIEAIVAQAYPLMVNRFGNFLIQRCFEHGTPEQVVAIANAIQGNTLSLSMDPFGCHVVQKAFDSVPEEYKAVMVHELLRRIPETVIHRYACHVWQKLFELRWSDSPPQIMKYVNEALLGMWHEVALGETGSLVVQNIFENCLEEDKRPCLAEVLHNIDIVAHGQFGNWCIQHICEHGAPADRSRAVEHILRYATEYSMDQFASKVVEKCLKIGGNEFLGRYLERVCEGRPDRPRMPLIDIASDQYGNYLIQWILMHCDGANREIVASQIRKHMVSLRGSKFGSRVAMLCGGSTYSHATGPIPGNNRLSSAPAHMPRFHGAFR